ncbi:unnamed protein product [Didymodactylos carnosus]|uniref:Major facilitator superfamily domain-containing protein 12-like n=1 Tax=Didymodactylos carnosus TaxID=1234261 RepID=A0A813TUU4_9BILA|nr:unnamed protein product [Didymodactylos carnosus]CAF0817640.1 unnamed protein product [Didymodactylos carnosus]CAF3500366.1 unnamed protein product [Didymodactylos carnosus]CAF3603878.1 unnamed protein product [Didymodactylos carnosus]
MDADIVRPYRKFAYSVGHVLNDLCASIWFSYLLVFYHRVVQFSNSSAGYLLLIGQVAGKLNKSMEKRHRSYLNFVGCVCSNSAYWAQFIYYASFIVIFQFGWACSQIAHLSMINELTHVDGERVQLNSYRYAWTVISNIFVYGCTWLLLGISATTGAETNDISRQDAHVFQTYIAVAPLCLYVSGFFTSLAMRYVNRRIGRKATMLFGLILEVLTAFLFWFIFTFHKWGIPFPVTILFAAVLLGIATSTTVITSGALASDLIAHNTESGAFVYGIMSFVDKIANGAAIAIIQQYNPCSTSPELCPLYYRRILTFVPGGAALLCIVLLATIWRSKIGNRQIEASALRSPVSERSPLLTDLVNA